VSHKLLNYDSGKPEKRSPNVGRWSKSSEALNAEELTVFFGGERKHAEDFSYVMSQPFF